MLIKSSIAFDMGMKLSTPDLTADLPLHCFRQIVRESKEQNGKENRYHYSFYVRRNFKDEPVYYYMYMYFFSQTEFSRRDGKNETKRQRQNNEEKHHVVSTVLLCSFLRLSPSSAKHFFLLSYVLFTSPFSGSLYIRSHTPSKPPYLLVPH